MNFLIWLIVGGVIGWLASLVMKTDGQQGLFLNVVVGIVGAMVALRPTDAGSPVFAEIECSEPVLAVSALSPGFTVAPCRGLTALAWPYSSSLFALCGTAPTRASTIMPWRAPMSLVRNTLSEVSRAMRGEPVPASRGLAGVGMDLVAFLLVAMGQPFK